jgi:DNA (cytosine-5)-methyltransferase 1
MSDKLLIRNVPPAVRAWIEHAREQRCVSQQEFVLALLKTSHERALADELPLLASDSEPTPSAVESAVDPAAERLPFTFIDLFAGVGGFRTALTPLGGDCVFSSEWDSHSQKTYRAWFGETPHGDIRTIPPEAIPDHDVLAAGFPCQPFSIAGVSKKNSLGRQHGFKCDTQGNLFFNLAAIARVKRPPVLLLENVKNLQSHDRGRTWAVIHETLTDLDYVVFHRVIDAAGWVPQHRERIYIVCFDRHVFGDAPPFAFPAPPFGPAPKLADILEPDPDPRYTLSDHLWRYLQAYAKKHQAKGNGFGYGLANPEGVTRTLSARYFKDGSEILVPQQGRNPRRLTPRECARLMGFPESRPIVVSDTQAYRQFGNAVVPKVVEAIGRQIVRVLWQQLTKSANGCLLKRDIAADAAGEASAPDPRNRTYGITGGRAGNRGRAAGRQRPPQVHLP